MKNNYVAKHAKTYNKAVIFEDKKKALKRGKLKHKSQQFKSDQIAA